MWLRDLLPQVMPNVRVMTYGCNASFLNYTAKQDVRSIAAKLLTELADLRLGERVSGYPDVFFLLSYCALWGWLTFLEESRRPIVFVCHSLGVVVAKKVGSTYCPKYAR